MQDRYDLVIVGMGSGGMTGAEFAAGLGLRVAVVERARVGGDCLWTGCVPSKALLASAKAAHTIRHADAYGLAPAATDIDTAPVWDRLRRVQHEIAATDDDPARYAAMGVEIVRGAAALRDANTVVVDGDRRLETRFVLLCTGSTPSVPPIPGLAEAGFLTSERVFDLPRAPRSIAFIGGGPIAIEMAQALRRLDVGVTALQKGDRILPRDDPALVQLLQERLRSEGVEIECGVDIDRVSVAGDQKLVHGTHGGARRTWSVHELFVAAGRTPNVDGLALGELGIDVGADGISVDDRLRTSVSSIYAAGDVAGRYRFTHSAGYEAVRAVRDMFFPGKGRADAMVPWCTFTDPELAHAGYTPSEAIERFGARRVRVWRKSLLHSDRTRAEGAAEGAITIVTTRGRIVGAHVLAPAAGELIHELALAIRERCSLASLGGLVHVYPTFATSVQQLGADAAFEQAGRLRWLVRVRTARR